MRILTKTAEQEAVAAMDVISYLLELKGWVLAIAPLAVRTLPGFHVDNRGNLLAKSGAILTFQDSLSMAFAPRTISLRCLQGPAHRVVYTSQKDTLVIGLVDAATRAIDDGDEDQAGEDIDRARVIADDMGRVNTFITGQAPQIDISDEQISSLDQNLPKIEELSTEENGWWTRLFAPANLP
ncbi:hypothetical protein BJX99DRAFT_260219 [Aspergillus californicus]